MALDIDLYNKLDGLTADPVEEGKLSEDSGEPRVWFQKRSETQELGYAGALLETRTFFDVEVQATSIDAVQTLAATVKTALHGFHGTMGGTVVLYMGVEDASDEYQYKGFDADEGFHLAAFHVEILS